MEPCIFCQIVSKEAKSASIWENDNFIAVLDLYPNVTGQALVISKKHYTSDLRDMDAETYNQFFQSAREVIECLEKGLKVQRVAMVVEGMGVDHAHIKLYPLHGLDKPFTEMWAHERIFFDDYQGYISTQLGPRTDIEELNKLAEKIRCQS